MEKITVEIDKNLFYRMITSHLIEEDETLNINEHYAIKKVEVVDDFFKDDPTYHTLKKQSNEAYKKLKEYEFKQRNK